MTFKFEAGQHVIIKTNKYEGKVVDGKVENNERCYLVSVENGYYSYWVKEDNLVHNGHKNNQEELDAFCKELTRERNIDLLLEARDFQALKKYLEDN